MGGHSATADSFSPGITVSFDAGMTYTEKDHPEKNIIRNYNLGIGCKAIQSVVDG